MFGGGFGGFGWADLFSALSAIGQVAGTGAQLYGMANQPEGPQMPQMPPMQAPGFGEAMQGQKKLMGRTPQDIQSQMGGATVSPDLLAEMLGISRDEALRLMGGGA